MQFDLTETQQLIRQTARDFAVKDLELGAGEREREGRFPKDLLKQMAELGLMGVNVPEQYGGVEAGVVAYSLAMMEIARACASERITNLRTAATTSSSTSRRVTGFGQGSGANN